MGNKLAMSPRMNDSTSRHRPETEKNVSTQKLIKIHSSAFPNSLVLDITRRSIDG